MAAKPKPELDILPLRAICNLPDGDLDSSEIAGRGPREEVGVERDQSSPSWADGLEQRGPSHNNGSGSQSERSNDVEAENEKKTKRTKL